MRRSQSHPDRSHDADEATQPVRRRSGPQDLLTLQRLAGNAVVVAATEPAPQAGAMQVGRADDAAEVAADRAAAAALSRLAQAPTEELPEAATEAPLRRAAAPAGAAEVGLEGGPVQPATAAAIEVARSSGRALDAPLRRSMETAFGGADFSGVRVHADERAAELNARVSARAFTTGKDIFFGSGEYAPHSESGRHVLAHELAHTLQQGGSATVGRCATVQRMAFDNTNWSAVNKAKISSGGGLGVLIIDDGSGPLVVKAGEDMPLEGAVAAKLLTAASGGGGTGWTASAPEARPVDATEAQQIHAKVAPLLGDSKREKFVLQDLAAGKGVMVFGFAKGSELQDSLKESQTKKGLFGASLRKDSAAYALMNDSGLLRTLGRASASDIATGNADRLVGSINFENVMLDLASKSISLIDNVQMKMESFLHDDAGNNMTGKESFKAWSQHERTAKLGSGNFKAIAAAAMDEIGKKMVETVGAADKKVVDSSFQAKKAKMVEWMALGLGEGTKNCLVAMKAVTSLISALPADQREEVATNLFARRNVLQGMGADAAWAAAESEAAALFAAPATASTTASAPQSSAPASPWKPASPKGKWKAATPKGKWKPAVPGGRA